MVEDCVGVREVDSGKTDAARLSSLASTSSTAMIGALSELFDVGGKGAQAKGERLMGRGGRRGWEEEGKKNAGCGAYQTERWGGVRKYRVYECLTTQGRLA